MKVDFYLYFKTIGLAIQARRAIQAELKAGEARIRSGVDERSEQWLLVITGPFPDPDFLQSFFQKIADRYQGSFDGWART